MVTDLAKGGCLTAFHWNSGGTWKGRTWDKDLPTDSQVEEPAAHVLNFPPNFSGPSDCHALPLYLHGQLDAAITTVSRRQDLH